MSDFDRLERLLERRADLLDASSGLLLAAAVAGRPFTAREQSAWDYACQKITELGDQFDELAALLVSQGYWMPWQW